MSVLPIRRRAKPKADTTVGAVSEDPYAHYLPQWTAYLDQGRWLLEQQQRRSAGFQQMAVALIGFDGVLLAVLVSGDALGSTTRLGLSWWATIAGTALLVVSSLAGVMAIGPRTTNVVGAGQTLTAWADLNKKGAWNRASQHFAEMLLNPDPTVDGAPTKLRRIARNVRRRLHIPEPPTQPLLATTHLATVRGRWTTACAVCLVLGLACLGIALLGSPSLPSGSTNTPAAVASGS